MALHLMRIVAIILAILACCFLPFLPGGYDGLAVTLSMMARLFSVAGLLLVPIGAAWLIAEFRQSTSKPRAHYFALAALMAASVIALLEALVAWIHSGFAFGLITLVLWVYVVIQIMPKLKTAAHPAPLYLVVIPVIIAFVQWPLVPRAIEVSRQRAIQQSAPLIHDIEQYNQANGRYPSSLAALHSDYKTGVIGIEKYHYEPYGEAFNLYFEQAAAPIGAREIVMYNQRDEHHLPSHDSDILRWTPEQLRNRKAYLTLKDTAIPHWKYFWFD